MIFERALKKMVSGIPMKLFEWKGYWIWDYKENNIMMHCADGSVKKLTDTENLHITLGFICSKDWTRATIENCVVLKTEQNADNVSNAPINEEPYVVTEHYSFTHGEYEEVEKYIMKQMMKPDMPGVELYSVDDMIDGLPAVDSEIMKEVEKKDE